MSLFPIYILNWEELRNRNMRRIGIVTIYDSKGNIGNKLQNYAVIKVFNGLECKCTTLATEREVSVKQILVSTVRSYFDRLISHKKRFNPYNYERIKHYWMFNKYLNVDYSLVNGEKVDFDFYSVGSDQVWNPDFYKYDTRRKDFYFLTFADDKKKIAFSPSFGISRIPEEWKSWFKCNLKTFHALSVREEAGAQLVFDLIGQKPEVLVDPTLMLDKEEWEKIAKKPKNIDLEVPYVLTYFLGDISEEVRLKCDEFSNTINGKCYHLLNPDNSALSNIGPAEFLMLIKNASLIMTDSFHACVFSFIFNKPFIVYSRRGANNRMFSRIETFLSTFNLERKYVGSGLDNDAWEHDYTDGYKQLEIEREKALNFLRKAIEE